MLIPGWSALLAFLPVQPVEQPVHDEQVGEEDIFGDCVDQENIEELTRLMLMSVADIEDDPV